MITMLHQDFMWKRFWCRRDLEKDEQYPLDEDGYFIAPASAALSDSGVVEYDAISNLPCLVMLGEGALANSKI
jgi:hypothetical protein